LKTVHVLACWSAGLILVCAVAVAASAQTFTSLADFDGSNSESPMQNALIQGVGDNFYGTALRGEAFGQDKAFTTTPDGTVSVVYSFCSVADCAVPAPHEGSTTAPRFRRLGSRD
jgi:hypothetical protein